MVTNGSDTSKTAVMDKPLQQDINTPDDQTFTDTMIHH